MQGHSTMRKKEWPLYVLSPEKEGAAHRLYVLSPAGARTQLGATKKQYE